MLCRLLTIALLFGGVVYAESGSSSSVVLSSSGFLTLPDTLSEELQQVASEGFWHGFKLATVTMVATGGLSIVLHLINRAAGR